MPWRQRRTLARHQKEVLVVRQGGQRQTFGIDQEQDLPMTPGFS